MELSNYSLKNKDAEYVTRLVLENLINVDDFLKILKEYPDWLENNIKGRILSSTLLELIEEGYNNQKYGIFLTYIIELVAGNVIDDLIFKKILCYPHSDIKEKILISLSHKALQEHQLRYLCNYGNSFECYFELAILYYKEKRYTLENLKDFIEEFYKSKYSYMAEVLIEEMVNYNVASDWNKYEYIMRLVQEFK